jgi:hypothetical protein
LSTSGPLVPKRSARPARFAIAVVVLGIAFAAVLRLTGSRSAVSIAALMAIEILAIAVALGFHLIELPSRSRVDGGPSAKG